MTWSKRKVLLAYLVMALVALGSIWVVDLKVHRSQIPPSRESELRR